MGRPLPGGEVEEGGGEAEQLRADLFGGAHREGVDRGLLPVLIAHPGAEGLATALRQCGALPAQLLQSLPAQGVESRQGEGEPFIHVDGDLLTGEGSPSGAGELSPPLLTGQGAVHGLLRHRAGDGGQMLLSVLDGHLGGLPPAEHGVHPHRLLPVLPALIGGPGLGEQLPGLRLVLTGAEHLRPLALHVVAVGKALPGKGQLQRPQLLPGGLPFQPEGVLRINGAFLPAVTQAEFAVAVALVGEIHIEGVFILVGYGHEKTSFF